MYGRYQTHQDKLNKLERQAIAKALDEPYDEGLNISNGIKTGGIVAIIGGMLAAMVITIVGMKMLGDDSPASLAPSTPQIGVGDGEVKIRFWQGDEEIPVTPKK